MKINVCILADKKLSIQLGDKELFILPHKAEFTVLDLEKAFNEVVKQCYDPDAMEWC